MKETAETLKNNWQSILWIGGVIFAMGSLYAEYKYLHAELDNVEDRLDKKIKVINDNTERINNVEKHLRYEDGFNKGKKDK